MNRVFVEVFFFSVTAEGLMFRVESELLPEDISPVELVHIIAGWVDSPPEGSVAHSTSWRYDAGDIVLSWAVSPDVSLTQPTQVLTTSVALGASAVSPVVLNLSVNMVAAHAARHLAFLLHTDPLVSAALHSRADLHNALVGTFPSVAGNPHF